MIDFTEFLLKFRQHYHFKTMQPVRVFQEQVENTYK